MVHFWLFNWWGGEGGREGVSHLIILKGGGWGCVLHLITWHQVCPVQQSVVWAIWSKVLCRRGRHFATATWTKDQGALLWQFLFSIVTRISLVLRVAGTAGAFLFVRGRGSASRQERARHSPLWCRGRPNYCCDGLSTDVDFFIHCNFFICSSSNFWLSLSGRRFLLFVCVWLGFF